jgi:hypothetical protein
LESITPPRMIALSNTHTRSGSPAFNKAIGSPDGAWSKAVDPARTPRKTPQMQAKPSDAVSSSPPKRVHQVALERHRAH